MFLLTTCKIFIFVAIYAVIFWAAYKLSFLGDTPDREELMKFLMWFHGILLFIGLFVGATIYIGKAGWGGQHLPKLPAESTVR